MINGILLAFFISLLGTVNLDFNLLYKNQFKKYFKGWLFNIKYGIVVAAVISYVAMPPLLFPDILVPILFMLSVNSFVTIAQHLKIKKEIIISTNFSHIKKSKLTVPLIIIAATLVLWIATPYIPLMQTSALNQIPDAEISDDMISSTNPDKIRQVPIEFAIWKADKVIGELGNRLGIYDIHVQIYQNNIVWVSPLEFTNFWKWLRFKESQGYVIVDAENPKKEVIKIDNRNFKYMQNAYFQRNIFRHVYQQFPQYRLEEFSFEIDEDGNPWWTITAVVPTVWASGEKVEGVILVNPENGDTYFYKDAPYWVDRVIPERVAEDYNFWFGAYKHGYINTLFTQRDMHLPTTKLGAIDVFAVRSGNDLVWFTGHTSPSSKDQSLVGYSTINTRTGKFTYFKNITGFYNEIAALSNANSKVSNFEGYHGTQPVFYNLLGELSWVIPILSSNNELQKIAIVHAKTGNVAIGDTLEESLKEYKKFLLENSLITDKDKENTEDVIIRQGSVKRINEKYLVLNEDSAHIFDIQLISNVEKDVTEKGDKVRVSYYRSNESVLKVIDFDNIEFNFS